MKQKLFICNIVNNNLICEQCTHSKPHKRTSDMGREPTHGRCSTEFCTTKNKKCKCEDVEKILISKELYMETVFFKDSKVKFSELTNLEKKEIVLDILGLKEMKWSQEMK